MNAAVAEYREATPTAKRNALEVWEVMLKAKQKTMKAIHAKNFEKYIFVAIKNNGDGFFDQVCLLFFHFQFSIFNYVNFLCNVVHVVYQINWHFSINTSPDMIIEKLRKVATSVVEPEYKAKWLH